MSEYNQVCDLCHESGGKTFARVYPEKINGNHQHLCNKCWDNQKQ